MIEAAPRWLVGLVKVVAAIPAAPLLLVYAAAARADSARRRRAGARPRIVWGPVPIISLKYWSAALRALGYESTTCVDSVYDIHAGSDFDHHRFEFGPRGIVGEPFRDFLVFAWTLRRADVHGTFFDGGFLRHTALRWAELPLLRLAGKRVVVSPYGSDIAVPGTLAVFEEAMAIDYPDTITNAERVRRRVDHFARWADLVVRNVQPGYLPRWDLMWPSQLAIDTDAWAPAPERPRRDEVVVVHAPNHRTLKATDAVVAAVDALREEGLPVRLELLERRPNEEVRRAIRDCDILAEQFLGGYGQLAVEGLSCGVPVMSRVSWLPPEVAAHPAVRDNPIVDADRDTLRDVLGRLVRDRAERERLGAAGREYVLRHQSYEAVGRVWSRIVDLVWAGEPVPPDVTHAPAR